MPEFSGDLITLVQAIGYPGLFAVILAESGLFFAFFLPGASLLFAAGTAAAFGVFNIWILVPLVLAAAIIGDNIGYWFGAKIGIKLFQRPDSRFFKQSHVDQTRAFFDRYGKITIILARFVPIIRTFAPILAGVGGMSYRMFFFYNVIGALVWAGGMTLLGYFLGISVPNAEEYLTPIILFIIFITVFPLGLHWFRSRKKTRVESCPRVAIFDVDDTLTESFKPPKPLIVEKLAQLLGFMPVAIMSAAGFPRIEREFLPALTKSPHVGRLYIFPNSTAECYRWSGTEWKQIYNNELTEKERTLIKKAVTESAEETEVLKDVVPKGQQMIDRGAQIAFAILGLDAPDEEKKGWDVDKSKRLLLQEAVLRRIPEYEVLIGGRTTLDVTKKGINKAYGVHWLSKELNIKPENMLYVGDALYEGGNDAVVIPTGIEVKPTSGPKETEEIIDALLLTCSKK